MRKLTSQPIFLPAAHAVGVGDFAIGVSQQTEIQFMFRDELPVAAGGIKADADEFDVVPG